MPQDSVSHICNKCVDEEYLSHAIETTGVIQTCSYCSGSRHCITVEVLADRIETAFAEHFVRTHNEPDDWEEFLIRDPESNYIWTRSGYPVLDAIQGAARISTEAAEDVLEILQYRHTDIESAQMGEESEFGPDTYYEEKDSNDLPWQSEWRKFEEALKTEARYFSRSAAAHLDAIFGGIDQLRTFDGQQLVADAGPGTDLETLFRARVFQSESALIEAIGRPDLHVGPTPPRKATAGRMNARGISVFYGAKERSVALAEVRPPVGSDVVVAEFLIIRHLRLLNLPALKRGLGSNGTKNQRKL